MAGLLKLDINEGKIQTSGTFHIPEGCKVLPVCEAGADRSGLLHDILKRRGGDYLLTEPHGALEGVDPFFVFSLSAGQVEEAIFEGKPFDADAEMSYQYSPLESIEEKVFEEVAKHKRIKRYLEETIEENYPGLLEKVKNRDVAEAKRLRGLADELLYMDMIHSKRPYCVLSFKKAVHVMLARLVEVAASEPGVSLAKITIVPINSPDPINFKAEIAAKWMDEIGKMFV